MADSAYPQPRWRVILDGKDISGRIAPRLMSLTVTSERGQDADQLDLTVSDHDGTLKLPRTGVTVDVALGWDTTGLTSLGTFTVDEVEHAGTPDKVTIRGRSAKMASAIRQKRTQSWDATTVGDMLRELAGRNGLNPRCAPSLAAIEVPHWDQTNESDLNILTRIGQFFDATATVKAGCLVFAPVGSGETATGKKLPSVTLTRRDGDQHRYHAADRDAYTGVKAKWHNLDDGGDAGVVAGDEQTVKTLRTKYASERDAQQAATAEWKRVQRGKATFELMLARGRADLYPEMSVSVTGFKPEIEAIRWLVKRVEHQLGDNGFTTRIECETADAPSPKVTSKPLDDGGASGL